MSNSALASLTAQYTDSENEVEGSPNSQDSQASQVIIPPKRQTPAASPIATKPTPAPVADTASGEPKPKKKKRTKKVRRLVSYQDDTFISDEEDDLPESESSSSSESAATDDEADPTDTAEQSKASTDNANGDKSGQENEESTAPTVEIKTVESIEKSHKYAHYNFSLPPEPKGKPLPELVEKIKNLYEKMQNTNMDMNRIIQERKDFRNPSIYEKLIQFCDINEFGTNYPPELYDPLQWGPESYYEELARVQKNEMLKRQKERKDTDKIEQATALARKVEEEAKKRKSKWDQPAASNTKSAVAQALTTTVTGTKGTVISAFGSLPKKPAN